MSTEMGFSFDPSRCSGCMACMVACMDQNDIPPEGRSYREVVRLEDGQYPEARIHFLSIACFHCADAPCMRVCPKGAISRDSDLGVVSVDENYCIGCRACSMVCPFGAPRFQQGGKMSKCNLCAERLQAGMDPACVHTCTTRALTFGPIEELGKERAKKASRKMLEAFLAADAKIV